MKKSNLVGLITILFSMNALAEVKVLVTENFESGTLPVGKGWSFGAQSGGAISVSTNTAENHGGSLGSIRGQYPKGTGGMYVWGSYSVVNLNLLEVYVEFDAKMPKAKQGLKFLKIFGGANTTFGADYTGIPSGKSSMYQVSFGDGTTLQNDTQNVINYNGNYPDWIGRSYKKTAKVFTPQLDNFPAAKWGDGWHHFRFRIKFNSGTTLENEVADGAYYVEIDGKTYVSAEGLFNRHYSNTPINRVAIFDWSQGNTEPFEVWYDNIVITTGGFLPSKRPVAPEVTR